MTWKRLSVTAPLVEPVTMTEGSTSRNRALSLDYVTGSSVRGALALRWLRANGFIEHGRSTKVTDPEQRALFLRAFESGAIRFPFLFQRGQRRSSLSRFACKAAPETHPTVDLAHPSHRGRTSCVTCEAPLEREHVESIARQVRTRTAIGEDGVVAEGMLYSQEELCGAVTFIGDLWFDSNQIDIHDWVPLNEPLELRVGADRSTQGRLRAVFAERDVAAPGAFRDQAHQWQEQLSEPAELSFELVMTLDTPALLTDAVGPLTGFTADLMASLLGVETRSVELVDFTSARTRDIAGWNMGAGLPKPTETVLIPGSTVSCRIARTLDGTILERLAQLEREGIGWRRAEGFGQVSFYSPMSQEVAQ